MKTTVKIHNDGKHKYQSYEVYVEGIDVRGFGATEQEALTDLALKLNDHRIRVTLMATNVAANLIDKVYVDYAGKEL